MTDIDFDELDKAVMSLMKDVKPDTKLSVASEEPAEKVLSISTNDKFTDQAPEIISTPKSTAETSKPEQSTNSTDNSNVPIFRRTGRIMDVAKGTTLKPITKPVSRQATIIAPPSSTISDVIAPPASNAATSVPVSVTQKVEDAPKPVDDPHIMPDPLDFTAMRASQIQQEKPTEPEVVVSEPEPEPDTTVEPVPEQSSTPEMPKDEPKDEPKVPASDYTPFIPDAKVEKRPLGVPSPASETISTAEPQVAADTPKTSEPTPNASAPTLSVLPDELDTNLVAIESGTASSLDVESNNDDDKEPTPSVQRPTGPGDKFAGQVQIPQQYQEAASSGEQEHVPIYDTATLHQPLAHPAKKPASWLWIIWILGIMLLGAGVAAALYYFHVF